MEQFKKKIFFFTDLDDTLIHSHRKLQEDKEYKEAGYNKKGDPHSYICHGTYKYINALIDNGVIVIPTTARNKGAYSRSIFYDDNRINLAIIDFGANILINNQEDETYREIIEKEYENLQYSLDYTYIKLLEFLSNFNLKYQIDIRVQDNHYIALSYDKLKNNNQFNEFFKNLLEESFLTDEYYLYWNNSSFSILPKFLNKNKAVKYLIKKCKPIFTMGAGDNINDLDFMKSTDMLLIPNNSQIYNTL